MRAFLAVELPESIRDSLAGASARLRKMIPGRISWVREDNLHITVRFLGEISGDTAGVLSAAVAAAAGETPRRTLRIETVGVYPNPGRARVLWAGGGGETEALLAFQSRCEAACRMGGLTAERKPWAPHVTLARFKEPPGRDCLGRALATFATFCAGEFVVEGVTLFSSALTPRGSVYTPVRKFPFSCPSTSSNEPSTTS